MRRIGGEAPHLLERALQARERVVEDAGQVAELVGGVLDGQPFPEPLGGDPARALGHAAHRGQSPPGKRVADQGREREGERQSDRLHEEHLAQLAAQRLLRARHPDDDGDAGDVFHAREDANA